MDTSPTVWRFGTLSKGGAEKPSRPLPGVHETAPHPRHFNEGTGGSSRSCRCRTNPIPSGCHLNEGTGSLSWSWWMTPWSASRSSYLNEGTGSLSRSFRVTITTLLLGKPQRRDREFIPVIWRSRPVLVVEVPTSTKGPGVYPGHIRDGDAAVLGVITSTKGPGVYPGHLLLAVLITPRVITSTKGPGVYPGHSCCVRTCTTTAPYLNEGTGSLSRSFADNSRKHVPIFQYLNEGTGSLSRS